MHEKRKPSNAPANAKARFSRSNCTIKVERLTPYAFLTASSAMRRDICEDISPLTLIAGTISNIKPRMMQVTAGLIVSLRKNCRSV